MDKGRIKQIMLLSRDEPLRQRLAEAMAGNPTYRLLRSSESLDDAYVLGVQGLLDLLLVDQRLAPSDPLAPVQALHQRLYDVPLVVLADPADADYIRQALLAGARAFLPFEFSRSSLIQTIDDLTRGATGAVRPQYQGRIIAVTSLKGGVGRTMLATNLAVALRQVSQAPVALVDGQLIFGDTEIDLNLNPQHSIADLVDQVSSLEPEVLDEAMVRHASGVHVLAATADQQAAERLKPEHLSAILNALPRQYAWIVVDTGNWQDARLDALLAAADTVLLLTTPEMTSLRAARLFLQMAREDGAAAGKTRLVINRADLVGGIEVKEIERTLGLSAYATLGDDSALVTYSVNRGVPLVLSHENKPLARNVRQLAQKLAAEVAAPVKARGRFPLFRRGGR